ncbi:MAG: rod shape-determining protein MreC [Hormoscilla sp. GM102CHS1]|nr:rod shape-determining protein MreC [Hormoscilla sp. GM102CHS1]
MYTVRRWWDRNWLIIVLVSMALGAAWHLRQTQGRLIWEMYQLVAGPLPGQPNLEERLINAKIMELQAKLSELESQNQELRALLDYQNPTGKRQIVAPIVGWSADHWWKQIILGRGSNDGIKKDFVVTGTGGVVGRVINVTPHTSRVLLIGDPTSRVGVNIKVGSRRYMGLIRGLGNDKAVMEFFDKMPNIRPGYKVYTSVVSQLFPPGLLVGVVESVDLKKSPAPEAVLQLTAPISHLQWTIVLENQPRLDIDIGEPDL